MPRISSGTIFFEYCCHVQSQANGTIVNLLSRLNCSMKLTHLASNILIQIRLSLMQGTDDYLATGEQLLIESARLVAKTGATLGTPA